MSGHLLSIFIPTFNRYIELDRLLESIIENNFRDRYNYPIIVSSNAPEDTMSLEAVKKWKVRYPYLEYYCNNKNIGIDANHDLIYKYCADSNYTLTIADDDILLEGVIDRIVKICKEGGFLFAICNAIRLIEGEIVYKKVYDLDQDTMFEPLELFDSLLRDVFSCKLTPLLPFYGGLIINTEHMAMFTTVKGRSVFEGSYHQYIGCLWNELFADTGAKAMMISDPIVAIGSDDCKKTWSGEREELYKKRNPIFYTNLNLDPSLKQRAYSTYKDRYLI